MNNNNYNKLKVKTIIECNICNIILFNTKGLGFISINKISINNDFPLVKFMCHF